MNRKIIGKLALKILEVNAKKNADKFCRTYIYEPEVPRKLKKLKN